GTEPDFPNEMLIGLNKDNPRLHDVYRANLTTGELKLDTKNPGDVIGWVTDPKFQVRAAQAMTAEGGMEGRLGEPGMSEWKTVIKWGPEDVDGRVIDFTADGQSLWLTSSEGRDTLALVRRNLDSGKEIVVASNPRADATGFIYDDRTHEMQAVA